MLPRFYDDGDFCKVCGPAGTCHGCHTSQAKDRLLAMGERIWSVVPMEFAETLDYLKSRGVVSEAEAAEIRESYRRLFNTAWRLTYQISAALNVGIATEWAARLEETEETE